MHLAEFLSSCHVLSSIRSASQPSGILMFVFYLAIGNTSFLTSLQPVYYWTR